VTGGTAWLCSTCFCFSCMSRTYRLQHTHTQIHSIMRNMNTNPNFADSHESVLRIRDPVPFWPLDPGSGMSKKSGFGSGMNYPDHISESLETMLWVKILIFSDADPESFWPWIWNPGWKKFGYGIRDKHPGSAKLLMILSGW
jgi:hypothetical protein